jgi:hypothetical protein
MDRLLTEAGRNAVNGWGNNPETWLVGLGAVTALGVIALFLTFREARIQRQTAETEMAERLRPWVGLFDFEYDPTSDGSDRVRPLLRNFGALPGLRAQLSLVIHPVAFESEGAIRWTEQHSKAFMPSEDGNYAINMASYPQFASWQALQIDLLVVGALVYGYGVKNYASTFEATISFAQDPDGTVANWRNTTAS